MIKKFRFGFGHSKKGFTIVELLISMTVFAVLIGLITNIFIGALRAQRRITALMTANDNASLVLEQIVREIRTGVGFCIAVEQGGTWICDPGNVVNGSEFMFENARGEDIIYRLNVDVVERWSSTEGRFLPITSEYSVRISNLEFYLGHNILSGAPWPPRITVVMKVGTKIETEALAGVFTNIQTTISGREF